MSIPRQIIDDYMKASEDLMKLEDLTDAETEAVQKMLGQLSAMITSKRDDKI